MKVLCISHKDYSGGHEFAGPDPEIGEECEVVGEGIGYDSLDQGVPCYKFAGYRGWMYDKRNFAPLNGPDEIEIAEARQLDAELAEVMAELQTA